MLKLCYFLDRVSLFYQAELEFNNKTTYAENNCTFEKKISNKAYWVIC